MAVNVNEILANLFEFYDFTDKTMLSVGAGGGQFIEYGRTARKVYAVDCDADALTLLKINLDKKSLTEKFTLIHSEFELFDIKTEVTFFEFCLHEMKDAAIAVGHALDCSQAVLISDHWIDSEWAFVVDEKEKVERSWNMLKKFQFQKLKVYHTTQRFTDYNELYQKVKSQGESTLNRIEKYQGCIDFEIPMSYAFGLIFKEQQ